MEKRSWVDEGGKSRESMLHFYRAFDQLNPRRKRSQKMQAKCGPQGSFTSHVCCIPFLSFKASMHYSSLSRLNYSTISHQASFLDFLSSSAWLYFQTYSTEKQNVQELHQVEMYRLGYSMGDYLAESYLLQRQLIEGYLLELPHQD